MLNAISDSNSFPESYTLDLRVNVQTRATPLSAALDDTSERLGFETRKHETYKVLTVSIPCQSGRGMTRFGRAECGVCFEFLWLVLLHGTFVTIAQWL